MVVVRCRKAAERLSRMTASVGDCLDASHTLADAADRLEAQAKRIAELEAALGYWKMQAGRIEALEAAADAVLTAWAYPAQDPLRALQIIKPAIDELRRAALTPKP